MRKYCTRPRIVPSAYGGWVAEVLGFNDDDSRFPMAVAGVSTLMIELSLADWRNSTVVANIGRAAASALADAMIAGLIAEIAPAVEIDSTRISYFRDAFKSLTENVVADSIPGVFAFVYGSAKTNVQEML